MKKLLFIIPFLFVGVFVNAQILDPVIWEFSQSTISESEVELQFKASIEKHWHLYSQFTGQYYNDEGPIPTSFVFKESDFFIKKDSVIEEPPIEDYDPIWEETLKYYEGEVTFRQRIKLLTKDPFNITGEINFMLCDEAQCVFPMPVPFSFNINSNGSIQEAEEQEIVTNQDIENTEKYNDALVELNNPSSNCGEKKTHKNTLWAIFILGLLGGLIALITPCVFPMIPITVSFFVHKNNKTSTIKNALFYGLSIIVIFTFLGIFLSFFLGPNTANDLASNWLANILFFIIFTLFGFSLLGFFEITIPSKVVNIIDKQSNQSGILGVFFMAFTFRG